MSSSIPHMDGVTSRFVTTPQGQFHLLESGPPEGQPVVFIHGNVSAATFWEELMVSLPPGYRALALDLRGYGESDPLPVDATRGLRDFSDDIAQILQVLGVGPVHLIGNSMGGTVAMQYALDYPTTLQTLTLVAPGSPFGFGGTKDVVGTPCWSDFAGSGGGLVHPEIIKRLTEQDRSEESDFSPRNLLRKRYVKPPFVPTREDALVEAMLQTCTNEGNYSRDLVASTNWPGIAPGTRGVNNALSPKYCHISLFASLNPKPPVLWIRGADDQIVSDRSLSEPGTLGAMGIIPDWPGNEVFPSQPMLGQIRTMLDEYRRQGGSYEEHILANTGHVPYLQEPEVFRSLWIPFLLNG